MKTIANLAWANTKFHRSKNILSGIAIILTTILVYLILSIGIGTVNVQNYVVNKVYPAFHAMYRNISETKKDQLVLHEAIETSGLRQDVGEIEVADGRVLLAYLDEEALVLTKMNFTEGQAPINENQIATSQDALAELGYPAAKIGDTISIPYQVYEENGLGLAQEKEFELSGFLPDVASNSNNQEKIFSMLVSQNFMETAIPENQREYRVMVRIASQQASTTDAIEEQMNEVGNAFDVPKMDIVANGEYLSANYIDPSFLMGVALIVAIVLIAGALTIYSIYYVSLINKVQEFGKLKALGATKRQIRLAVLLENLIVALVAIPLGLLISMLTVKMVFENFLGNVSRDFILMNTMRAAIESGEVSLLVPWIIAVTILVSLSTVLLSSLKPMRYASKIMPIEAMRYTGYAGSKQKQRKGYLNLTLQRLTQANLFRNKKRTLMTIFSLSAIGILFMVVSTIISCINPEQIARNSMAEDFRLSIESSFGDQMHPEREWTAIQQNNPLDATTLNDVETISGVENVYVHQGITYEIPEITDPYDELPLRGFMSGFDEEQFDEIRAYIEEGELSYDEFLNGDNIIATGYLMANFPEITVGSQLELTFFSGDTSLKKVLTVAALGNVPDAYGSIYSNFLASNQLIESLSPNNLNYSIDIKVADNQKTTVEQQLRELANDSEFLELQSYEDTLRTWESSTMVTSSSAYGIMIVLAVVGIMNLVNTTIDSILSRKKELGVMQALGMSTKQMQRMLQREGLFYAGGIILLSVSAGSILGYFVYLYAAANGLFQIRTYSYPIVQMLLLMAVIIFVQFILTIATTKMISRETIISRIQASE